MSDLEPITRNEMLWSGEDLEPKTRREMYIRHLYDETQVIPDSPKTREEMFILKAGEELHDVTIEQLTATENGTYTAPSGKAYSPVSVNVPLPSNAYLLKSIEHEQVATFTDGTDNFVKSLEVAIEPVQSGSGDPSPENVRPIIGWAACNVVRTGKNILNPSIRRYSSPYAVWGGSLSSNVPDGTLILEAGEYTFSVNQNVAQMNVRDNPDTPIVRVYNTNVMNFTLNSKTAIKIAVEKDSSQDIDNLVFQLELGSSATTYEEYNGSTYTIDLDGTRYGGKLDLVSGVLTVDKGYVDLGTLNWGKSSTEATVLYTTITGKKTGVNPMICDRYKYERDKGFGLNFGSVSDSSNASYVGYTFIRNSDFAGKTAVESATLLSGTQLVYELATPQTIQLTPTIIKSLQGANNLFASTGEIEMLQYWGEVS